MLQNHSIFYFSSTLLLYLLGWVSACKSIENTSQKEQATPANVVRLEAKIIHIKPLNESDCQIAACMAAIQVVKINSMGDAVKINLQKGDLIEVQFAYTLSPSADLINGLKSPLKKLKEGDHFKADMVYLLDENAQPPFVIHEYIKLKNNSK